MSESEGPRSLEALTLGRLRRVLDVLEEGVALIGPDGVVEYINASGERVLGVPAGEILGWRLIDFRWSIVDASGAPLPREALPPLRVLATGEPCGPVVVGMSSPAVPTLAWVEVSAKPLRDEAAGALLATVTSFRDVTDRVGAEEAQRASEERYHTLAESVPVGIFHTDPDHALVWVNQAWTDITGLSAEESLGDGWTRALHPDDRDGIFDAWNAAVQVGKPYVREHRYVRPDGEVRWVICRAVEQTDEEGRVVGRVGSVTDVTEAKNAGLLKDQIIGLVSHELRAPLISIRGGLTFLEPYLHDADALQLYRMATRNAELLERLVRDLLDIERLSAGHMSLEMGPVVVSDVLAQAREVVFPQAADRGVTLREPSPSRERVHADRDRMTQLFTNLLSNAVKFSEPGGEVLMEVTRSEGAVTVRVHDRGRGIAPEDHERIFDPFTQLGGGRTGERDGAGLGLAISRAIVGRHGGRIWVESALGEGASFYVALPAI